jgi:two-component system, NarL family, sensor histidine kinase BarA
MQELKKYLPQSMSEFTEEILELESAIVLVIDKKIGIIGVNSAFFNYLPFKSLDAFSKKHKDIAELFLPGKELLASEKPFSWLYEVLKTPKDKHKVKMLDKEGNENLFSVKIKDVVAEGKSLFIVQFDDISAFEKAKQAQTYFEEFKQKFLTSMSHEFRTPMNGIIGFVDLLGRTETDRIQQEYVKLISHSAQTMMHNVENLLELAQIESGQIHLNEQTIDLINVMETFSNEFYESAREKEVQLLFYIDPLLPKELAVDIDKLKKVLRNLIENAIKYTDKKGQVYVEIRANDIGKNGEVLVEYSVTDTGVGIDQNRLSTIIRPFASAKDNQSRGKDGLGVGLTVCFKLTDMMGSKLKLATEVGKGSRFSFSLEHKSDNENAFEFVKGSRMAIWAEDYYTVLYSKLLKEYLDHFGVEVIEIDGLANKELKNCDAVFIVTDHLSHSRIKSIKATYRNLQIVPVINPFHEEKFETIIDEVEDVLMKPLLPHKIYETLNVVWKKVPPELLKRVNLKPKKPKKSLLDLTILVAEDNPINLKLIETLLSQYKLKVRTVVNGKEAVDVYDKEKKFDLVFMDIDMPVMDGITATRLMKEIGRRDGRGHTPIIALTAHGLSGDRERIIAAGLDEHLPKPLDRTKLEQVLKQYLDLEIN